MNNFITSNSIFGIKFTSDVKHEIGVQLPNSRIFMESLIIIYNENEVEVCRQLVVTNNAAVNLMNLVSGLYYICIYTKSIVTDNLYHAYIKYGDIPFSISNGCVNFIPSAILANNIIFFEKFPNYDRRILQNTAHIQAGNINIRNLARQIVENSDTQLDKIRAVHEWVAKNISYDYDSLIDDVHVMKDNTALGAYAGRKCVCRGYTNLVVALLRSLHIPAVCVYCQSLNVSKEGRWDNNNNSYGQVNHVFPAAYTGNRWVLMDTTWDSRNIFENGHFLHNESCVYPYKYFDVSLDFISQTHRLISIGF